MLNDGLMYALKQLHTVDIPQEGITCSYQCKCFWRSCKYSQVQNSLNSGLQSLLRGVAGQIPWLG